MAIPITANTTCDIYRAGSTPPTAPDVASVPCFIRPAYREGKESAEGALLSHQRGAALTAGDVSIGSRGLVDRELAIDVRVQPGVELQAVHSSSFM